MMGIIVAAGLYNPDCANCHKLSPEQRKFKGCDGPAPVPLFEYKNEKYFECPSKVAEPWVLEFISYYSFCKKFSILPISGGLLDQTNLFFEASMFVESMLAEIERDKYGEE